MSNIERRYSYHDDGVLPSKGEYGVTYLTLYSSGAGNCYDGWIWDPDHRTTESETERTFGYRNPDYTDYCWDDEVIVDLSNAQTRQESSEFEQGRITSFNTNVSDQPILLQDVDITGLNEEEREAKATTVLFSKIPLVKDAYIQAMVEIQAKMNISPTNTNGMVRVEAFYILNNESDRTMRPNPVHTFSVSTANERHTLPWLYWNPALKHEDNNYIGVKLLCTGGTAEIGISDDPAYGDAMITLTSAGLVGDHIDSGRPVSLEIYGRSLVPAGYRIKEDDYTVLVTYDTGEVYDVSRICTYSPVMGTKIVDPTTTLTAYYQGLSASMIIILAMPESIEMIGVTDFYEDTYELKSEDYVVYAYYETGDVMDISDDEDLVYSPAMGTTINQTTTLTATFSPTYAQGSTFTDSLTITKHSVVTTGTNNNYPDHLIYTLYDDGYIEITGNANNVDPSKAYDYHEIIELPQTIRTGIYNQKPNSIQLKWNASGEIGGINVVPVSTGSNYAYLKNLINFSNVEIKPYVSRFGNNITHPYTNPIVIKLTSQEYITSEMLSFLGNIIYEDVYYYSELIPISIGTNKDLTNHTNTASEMLKNCKLLTNIDFCKNWRMSRTNDLSYMYYGCTALSDISGAKTWDVSLVYSMDFMFYGCDCIDSARDLSLWNPRNASQISHMFQNSGLSNLAGIGSVIFGSNNPSSPVVATHMFMGTKIRNLIGLSNNFFKDSRIKVPTSMFANCESLTSLAGGEGLDFSEVESMLDMFSGSYNIDDISAAANWDVSNVVTYSPWGSNKVTNISHIINWELNPDAINLNCCPSVYVIGGNLVELIRECSCDVSMWSEYSNTFDDTKIFGIRQIGGVYYLMCRTTPNPSDDPDVIHHTYYYVSGLFGNRCVFYIDSSNPNNPIFVNPNAIPAWYRIKVSDYVTSGNWLSS